MIAKNIILLLCGFLLHYSAADHVNPEEALFSYTRCMEIYGNSLEEPLRNQSISKWAQWDINATDGTSVECYTQCVLERLTLFNAAESKINVDLIDEQFSTYGELVGVSQSDKDDLKSAFTNLQSGSLESCKDLYQQYITIHNDPRLLDVMRKLFHGYIKTVLEVYNKENGKIRNRKQSYFEFCEKQYYGDGNEQELCHVRGYNIDTNNPEKFEQHTKCIFEGLRYLNKDGKYNGSEIQRDFELVNEDGYKAAIEDCISKSTVTDVYRCFIQSEDSGFTVAFKKAFDYREIRSRDYGYRIYNPKYDQAEIRQLVGEVDTELKCA